MAAAKIATEKELYHSGSVVTNGGWIRRKFGTIIELILPLLFGIMIVALKSLVSDESFAAQLQNQGYNLDELPWPGVTTIYYGPNNAPENEIMSQLRLRSNGTITFTGMSLDDLNTVGVGKDRVAAISFPNPDSLTGNQLNFSLRFPRNPGCMLPNPARARNACTSTSRRTWRTTQVYAGSIFRKGPKIANNTVTNDPYYFTGFARLQYEVSRALINVRTTGSATVDSPLFSRITSYIQLFPYAEYSENAYATFGVKVTCALVLVIAFIYPVISLCRDIVMEKELVLKESMRMMGLSISIYWMSWAVKAFSMHVVSMIIFGALLKGFQVVDFVNVGIVIVFLILYLIALIAFVFMVSTFFSSAKVAAAASGIFFFATYIPYQLIKPDEIHNGTVAASCLAVNTCMAWGWNVIGSWEEIEQPMAWSQLGQQASRLSPISLSVVYGMLVVDTVIFLLIAFYIENVFPGTYGVSKPWYFLFTRRYWCGRHSKNCSNVSATTTDNFADDIGAVNDPEPLQKYVGMFETEPNDLRAGVKIENLTKRYSNGKLAVHDLSLNMYEGQITCLLGHNGAGKSTTMAMLTGLYEPTYGNAYINSYSIVTEIEKCRESLGLCPQVNTLFSALTVREQLRFFGRLKGIPEDSIEKEIDQMLDDLRMHDKVNSFPKGLSGGMRRKLCVGIALIGGSKVVFLDEPTSGMDPSARRATWELITKNKPGRTILLTTHFMDEADLLGNRIAIMAEGQLQACGSSLYLKKHYGVGYQLVLVKKAVCDPGPITTLITKHVPDCKLLNNVGRELSYQLPSTSLSAFPTLFRRMDESLPELQIESYGVSCTTLEEVFLKIGTEAERQKKTAMIDTMVEHDPKDKKEVISDFPKEATIPTELNMVENGMGVYQSEHGSLLKPGFRLIRQRFWALFMKRFWNSKRDWKVAGTQLFFPVIFLIIALVIARTQNSVADQARIGTIPRALLPNEFFRPVIPWSDAVTTPALLPTANSITAQFRAIPHQLDVSPTPSMAEYLLALHRRLKFRFLETYLGAFALTNLPTTVNGTIYYSSEAQHGLGVFLGLYMQTLLRTSTGNNDLILTATNAPYHREASVELGQSVLRDRTGFSVAIDVVFGFSFLYASLAIFLIRERVSKAKHIQFVSGVTPLYYWGSTFIWDFLNTLIPIFICMIVLAGFGTNAYTDGGRMGIVFLLLVLFSWASIPLVYLLSRFANVPATGFSLIIIYNLVTGLGTVIAVFAVRSLAFQNTDNYAVARILTYVFYLFPSFSFGMGMMDLFVNWQMHDACETVLNQMLKAWVDMGLIPPSFLIVAPSWCNGNSDNAQFNNFIINFPAPELHIQFDYLSLASPGIGGSVLALLIAGFFFMGLVLLMEYKFFIPAKREVAKLVPPEEREKEDFDVEAEYQRIMRGDTAEDVITVQNLAKVYPPKSRKQKPKTAVDGLTFGIPTGECFGLLGVNGAGKTTTFGIMTGDHPPSFGDVVIDGYSIATDIGHVRQRIGYCPQFDALIELMTGRETLTMYARLRGVRPNRIDQVVSDMIDRLDLAAHCDRLCGTYSGGNKRKLSTAMALIGDPPVVFLDEPTTGVDPATRRFLWDILATITKQGRCVVLTSHSMEECEALCTRLTIMVNGRFRCLGSVQHLKSRFDQGYRLQIKASFTHDTSPLKHYVQKVFDGAVLAEEHQGLLTYNLPKEKIALAQIFDELETAKETLGLDDYSVSQTTLEQ
eukprot:Ihof_evm21s5 gene=Ihof_evmTU21s5